jgi:hypothetical protein
MSTGSVNRNSSRPTPQRTPSAASTQPAASTSKPLSTPTASPKPQPTTAETKMVQTQANAYGTPKRGEGLSEQMHLANLARAQSQTLERGNRNTTPKPLPKKPVGTGAQATARPQVDGGRDNPQSIPPQYRPAKALPKRPVNTAQNTSSTASSQPSAQTGIKQQSAMKAPPGQIIDFGNSRSRDHKYDGGIVGGNGAVYSAKTDWNNVQGTTPNNGKPVNGKCLFVNGMYTPVSDQKTAMQNIANSTGHEVVGIHNATHGFMRDLGECTGDKLNFGHNGAHKTLTNAVVDHVKNKPNEPLNIVAHSQGGIITSRALRDARLQLRADDPGMTAQQAQQALKNVSVQTGGAAAVRYPEGPSYLHHVNKLDPVPTAVGLSGMPGFASTGVTHSAAKHGTVNTFTQKKANPHDMNEVYSSRLVPFNNIYTARQT